MVRIYRSLRPTSHVAGPLAQSSDRAGDCGERLSVSVVEPDDPAGLDTDRALDDRRPRHLRVLGVHTPMNRGQPGAADVGLCGLARIPERRPEEHVGAVQDLGGHSQLLKPAAWETCGIRGRL